MFFKKKKVPVNIIEVADVDNFIELSFKESADYKNLLDLKQKFDYEFKKLNQYSDILLSRDFESRIPQDKDYFKKVAKKIYDAIHDFLDSTVFPESVFLYSDYEIKILENIESLESEIEVLLNRIDHILPKLVVRIRAKLEAIHDVITEYHRFIENSSIKKVDEISELLQQYYKTEEKIHALKEKRIPLLDELTKVSLMKDRVDVRLKNCRNKRNMSSLNKKLVERDDLLKKLKDKSSLIKLNLSYVVELISGPEFNDFETKLTDFINKGSFLDESDFQKLKKILFNLESDLELDKETNTKVKQFIDKIKESESDLLEGLAKFKELKDVLNNNVLYLNIKEQEDSFRLWNSKFKNIKQKIKVIDDEISDLSLDLIKQKINNVLQDISKNTVVN
jgi:hypothetical protein